MKNKSISTKQGFTLLEMLVVITIITLLAGIILISTKTTRGKARDARKFSDIKEIQTALELYYDKYGKYVSTNRNPEDASTALVDLVSEKFFSEIPSYLNPKTCGYLANRMYVYSSDVTMLLEGTYGCSSGDKTNNTYALEFCLENPNPIAGNLFPSDGCGRYCYYRCVANY